jgi:DNA-binding XRE family transcriptional regulator
MQREWDSRLIVAARGLAGLTIEELAAEAGVTKRTVSRLEVGGVLHIAAKKRHGHVSQEVWSKIINALARHGVELLPEGRGHGSGVRWARPRADRVA